MAAPQFVHQLLGWRDGVPNVADRASETSIAIAAQILNLLGVTHNNRATGQQGGRLLEEGVEAELRSRLPGAAPHRTWVIGRRRLVTDFAQYSHLARLNALINQDETGTLSVEIGRDYLIAPDVTVGIEPTRPPTAGLQAAEVLELPGYTSGPAAREAAPVLHAAVSCKLTIRSDRVQNIRHEGVVLTRHRRGRQPHIVVVTSEPLPTRIAAIARGTGEVDAVYHVCLEELMEATSAVGTAEQQQALTEAVHQGRLGSFDALVDVLAI